jgi:hypothetical protein
MVTRDDQELIDRLEKEVQDLKRVVAYMNDALHYQLVMNDRNLAASKTTIARGIFKKAFLDDAHNG